MMGEARRRGTREERVAQAKARQAERFTLDQEEDAGRPVKPHVSGGGFPVYLGGHGPLSLASAIALTMLARRRRK